MALLLDCILIDDAFQPIDYDAPVNLYHFFLLRSIGKGAFGKVRVIQHKQVRSKPAVGSRDFIVGLSVAWLRNRTNKCALGPSSADLDA